MAVVQVQATLSQTTSLELGSPWGLALLAAALPVALLWLRARRAAKLLGQYMHSKTRGPSPVVLALRLTSIALLALAASQPHFVVWKEVLATPENVELLEAVPVHHVVVVDVSKSMGYREGPSSRFDLALKVVEAYLEDLPPGDTATLMAFSSSARVVCRGPPTDCLAAVHELKPGERYSAVGDAIAAGASAARASGLPSVVVVVTDGAWNYGSPPGDALRASAAPVVLVLVGSDPRSRALVSAAEELGVKVFRASAPDPHELVELARKAYAEARTEALKARGKAVVRIPERIPASHLLAALSAIAYTASVVGGL